jgi:hypothetical protein
MKTLAIFLVLLSCAAIAQTGGTGSAATAKPAENYSGMYTFLKEGEFVQVTVEDAGKVTGFVSRYGDLDSDRGSFLDQVFKEGKTSYRRAVFVEWPRAGVRAIGFVTGEVLRDGEKLVVVYIPTMPNPTSGFALFFRESEVHDSGMTVEEAVKFVVSGGAVVH